MIAGRYTYISTRTARNWQDDEGVFYTDIADVIRQISSQPRHDLHETSERARAGTFLRLPR